MKPSVKLVAEIRKHTQTSMIKAREALAATNNDLKAALEWLEKDLAVSGAKKAAKLEGRTTEQGLIAIAILSKGGWEQGQGCKPRGLGTRAAMVELNCETDFVARNDLFVQLARDISHTAAFISEPAASASGNGLISTVPLDLLQDAPYLSSSGSASHSTSTIASAIRDTIAKVGEKISLRRVCTVVTDPLTDPTYGLSVSSYIHGSSGASSEAGRLGSLVALGLKSRGLADLYRGDSFARDVDALGRSISRQIVGLNATSIRNAKILEKGDADSSVLYDQPFVMAGNMGQPDESVGHVLGAWSGAKGLIAGGGSSGGEEAEGVEVVQFEKWMVGESLES